MTGCSVLINQALSIVPKMPLCKTNNRRTKKKIATQKATSCPWVACVSLLGITRKKKRKLWRHSKQSANHTRPRLLHVCIAYTSEREKEREDFQLSRGGVPRHHQSQSNGNLPNRLASWSYRICRLSCLKVCGSYIFVLETSEYRMNWKLCSIIRKPRAIVRILGAYTFFFSDGFTGVYCILQFF